MFFANRLEPCLALDDSQVARGPGFIGLHAVSEPDTFDDFGNLVSFYPVVKGCQSNSGMSPSVFPTPACRVDLHTASTPNGHNASRTLEKLGLEYIVRPINLGEGDQKTESFWEMNPNNRIPVDAGCALFVLYS